MATEQELLNRLTALEAKNVENVREIMRRTENPNPLFILFIIIVVLSVMYFIFINFIKKSITGIWTDDDNKEYNIIHNKWKDTIIVDRKYHGIFKGHIVIVYMNNTMQLGIYNDNKIKWTNGTTWTCSYGY